MMNTPTSATATQDPRTAVRDQTIPELPLTRQITWALRRELWESRSVYLVPLGISVLVIAGFLVSTVRLPARLRAAASSATLHQVNLIEEPYMAAALLIMASTFIVGMFYSVDALYGERRDRSILFWKSLPVSDMTTVLTKAGIPILLLPFISLVLTVATHIVMLLVHAAVLVGSGIGMEPLAAQVTPLSLWTVLLFHLMVGHTLWYAPLYGWLLLVSAWARRAPFLWAVLPPLAIVAVERLAFGTQSFLRFLQERFFGSMAGDPLNLNESPMGQTLHHSHAMHFFMNPSMWFGLLVTGAFLIAAVRLRRDRGPI